MTTAIDKLRSVVMAGLGNLPNGQHLRDAHQALFLEALASLEKDIKATEDRIRKAEDTMSGLEWCPTCRGYWETDYHVTIHRYHDGDEEGVYCCESCGAERG